MNTYTIKMFAVRRGQDKNQVRDHSFASKTFVIHPITREVKGVSNETRNADGTLSYKFSNDNERNIDSMSDRELLISIFGTERESIVVDKKLIEAAKTEDFFACVPWSVCKYIKTISSRPYNSSTNASWIEGEKFLAFRDMLRGYVADNNGEYNEDAIKALPVYDDGINASVLHRQLKSMLVSLERLGKEVESGDINGFWIFN